MADFGNYSKFYSELHDVNMSEYVYIIHWICEY